MTRSPHRSPTIAAAGAALILFASLPPAAVAVSPAPATSAADAEADGRTAANAGEATARSAARRRLGDRILRRGMRGPDVRELQAVLRALGFRTLVDGDFGPGTQADVKRYERRRRIRADGVVSPRQARQMKQRAAPKAPARGPGDRQDESRRYGFGERTLRRGAAGPDVATLQKLLTKLGYPTTADGDFGPATESGVRAYEGDRKVQVDGVVPPRQARRMQRRAARSPQRAPGGGGGSNGHYFPIRGLHSYGGAEARFGADRGARRHQGQDVFAATGTPLVSVTAGRVAYRQYQAGGAGNYVVIHGGDGTDYIYMHLNAPGAVAAGQAVRAGQYIGRVGCTGHCSGAHLHFEMWTPHWYTGGRPFDPLPSLRRWDVYS